MSITPEMIAAYADGELDGAERDRVEQALAQDPALARQVEAHRALKARLFAHFAPVLDAPLPEALTRAIKPSAQAEIIPLDATRRARSLVSRWTQSRWAWGAGAALAASLTLAIVLGRPGAGADSGYADGALATALDTQLSGPRPSGGAVRIMLSFADSKGSLCRGYAGKDGSGIACRDARGWRLDKGFPATESEGGGYRQAGSADPRLMEAMQAMAVGAALDADAERAAIVKGWRR